MENDKVKQELRLIIEEVYDAFKVKLYHYMNKM